MGRPELGSKCICASCAERFYDLQRTPPLCPKCGLEYTAPKPKILRPTRSTVESRQLAAKVDAAPAEDAVDDEDADDDEPTDADDDDDAADVLAIDPDREKTPD